MKKIFASFFIFILILGANGCMNNKEYTDILENFKNLVDKNTQETADSVKNGLSLKYGCDFDAVKIGGRIDTNSTVFYLHPDFDTNIVFKAVIDSETEEITDNFISRIIASKINTELKEILDKYNISGEASVNFVRKNDDGEEDDIDITVEEYFEEYEVKSIFLYLAINSETLNDASADNLISVCKAFESKYNTQIAVNGVAISDKYYECSEQMKTDPEVSATWFDSFNPDCSYKFAVTDGKSNVSVSELKEILAGE